MQHARKDYNRIQDPTGLIPEDEPVFLLRGQDVAAPSTLRHWAEVNDLMGGDPNASVLAREHAQAMEEWQETVSGPRCADL